MSYLINDNLIWIMTPKCASFSIERALLRSNLKLKKYNEFLEENKKATLVGISNKRNLIFKLNNEEYKVSPKGSIL